MKMEVFAVFVILVTIITRISADSNCRTSITHDDRRGMYSCARATLDDVNEISDDAEWIRFMVSNLSHLPERAFARFALQGLSFYKCKIDDIHPNAFDGLDKLRRLTFHESYILVLKATWFKGLSSLTHLFVDRADLVYIEPDVFPLISNLELLNIEDNNLNCLPSKALAPLRKLKHARIGKNPWLCSCYAELSGYMKNRRIDYGRLNTTEERLECMMEHVPQYRDFMVPLYKMFNNFSVSETGYIGMNKGRDVMCFGNDISALSEIPDNVKSIKFVNSQISKIPRFAFLRFGNSLTSLYFRNCSIRDIHPDAFAGLPKLEMLFLFDNNFGTVRSEWFRDLHSLENLALDKNGIDYIQPSVFPLLDKLKHLSLGNNRIQCISTNEFNSLKHLKEVILAHNPWNCSCQENFRKWLHENRVRYVISRGECINGKIQESEDLFEQSFERHGTKIKSQNAGEIMPKHEHQNHEISTDTVKYLEAKLHETREAEADHFRNIKLANYEYYRLKADQQNEYFAQETHLDGKNYTDSEKSEDDVSICSSRDYNQLDKVTKDITQKDLSAKLSLSDVRNSYITIGGTIWDVSAISSDARAIRFQNSAIPKIFNIFSRFGSTLRRLEFLNCMVRDIEPQAFKDLMNLQVLVLSDNQIQEVRSAWFDGIPNLRRLSLARNSITRIDNGVFQLLTNLEQLDLSNNQLSCLNVEGLSHLRNLNTINIGNNPWSCLCQKKLNEWLDQHEDYIQDFSAEIGDRDCSTEYTDFRMTDNRKTNSIDGVNSDAEKEIEGSKDVEEIEIAQEMKKSRETISTTTENSKIIETGDNSADLSVTATNIRGTTPTTTTTKPENFNTRCRFHQFNQMRENRWWCNGGDISVLDEIPSNAERIDIINANISVIPANSFVRFENLTRLFFYHSNVRNVEPLAFNTLIKLEWLVFLNNSIPTVKSWWFRDLGNLTLLGLVRNSITEIEPHVFDHLPNLERLFISENNLRCIYTKSLSSLKYLQRVMIQNNPWKWRCREELSQFFDARNISYVISEAYEGRCVVTDLLTDETSELN